MYTTIAATLSSLIVVAYCTNGQRRLQCDAVGGKGGPGPGRQKSKQWTNLFICSY